jgi:23S rRNA (cytosine1962-C5)-methyltransferase
MLSYITANDFADCQRLFHGRGHAYENLSHINVDWFSPVILITLYKEVDPLWLQEIAVALSHLVVQCRSVQVQYRCRQMAPTEVLIGDSIEHTVVDELGLKYNISFGKTQNSGLFLDMRNGREWTLQNSKQKNVLNLFSYTCPFSVAAIAGGADKVVNIDISKASLSKGRENHRLNEHPMDKVKFEGVDIFKSNSRIKKHGPYDLIISDPPSLQFGSVNIERDYAKIIRRVPTWLKPGGDIMLCLNSPELSEQFLHKIVKDNCPDCQFQQQIAPPAVFKEAHPGKGLKVLIFKYLAEPKQ